MSGDFKGVYTTKGSSQANYFRMLVFKEGYTLDDVTHVGDLYAETPVEGTMAHVIKNNINYIGELGSIDAGFSFSTSDSDGAANGRGDIIGDKKTAELSLPVNTPDAIVQFFIKDCVDQARSYVWLNVTNGECTINPSYTAKENREITGGGTSLKTLSASKEGSESSALWIDKKLLDYANYGDPVIYDVLDTYVAGDIRTPIVANGYAFMATTSIVATTPEPIWDNRVGAETTGAVAGDWVCVIGNTGITTV